MGMGLCLRAERCGTGLILATGDLGCVCVCVGGGGGLLQVSCI